MTQANVFWFTGLSGVGKSTVANSAKKILEESNYKVLIIDGDNVRNKLNKNLGFSTPEIKKNNKVILELCIKNRDEYDLIFVAIISPYKTSRSQAKKILGNRFYEIFLTASKKKLFKRDTKGLYKKVLNGEINNLIGISSSSKYEPPESPDLRLDTDNFSEEDTIKYFINFVKEKIET